ncbi:hypothetical protein [Thalassotalea crassostreae]|uniref:hypothetical protein n=1 Tax=Thalassotalea crassostreae TaxID=1763536 RepID=UPI00083949D6|nr:hypothetical protein [Thalassotalea crassostreae]
MTVQNKPFKQVVEIAQREELPIEIKRYIIHDYGTLTQNGCTVIAGSEDLSVNSRAIAEDM